MDNNQNEDKKAPEAVEENDIGMSEPVEPPSETSTDSDFGTESGGGNVGAEDPVNEDPSGEGSPEGNAPDENGQPEEEDGEAETQSEGHTDKCNIDFNKLACEDIERALKGKRRRDNRDLMARVFNKDGCVFKSEYTLKRFCQSVIWYNKEAKKNKRRYFVFSTLTIILPTAVTFLNSFPDIFTNGYKIIKISVTAISAAAAIMSSMLSLFKFQHKWIQFRGTSEELQTELSLFISKSGAYSDESLKEQVDESEDLTEDRLTELRENQFLVSIEKIMIKEQTQWVNLHKPSK